MRLVDGHDFAVAAAGASGPLLIAHTHADWVLSDIKLAAEEATGDEPVVILQGLGTADERIIETTWSELDRAVEPDHLTCVYVPWLGAPVGAGYVRFHELTRTLRERCPWDREQTHASLVPYLVEETFELVDALGALDPDDPATDEALIEELGDLLYQIEFHATIAEQEGRFSIADVTAGIHDKLVRRHPHVFGDVEADDAGTVVANWDEIKRAEKDRDVALRRRGPLAAGPRLRPAADAQGGQGRLRLARRGRAARPRSTRSSPSCARRSARVATEARSPTSSATSSSPPSTSPATPASTPSSPSARAAGKFRRRFEAVEALAAERGIDLRTAGLATLDALWDEVKTTSG